MTLSKNYLKILVYPLKVVEKTSDIAQSTPFQNWHLIVSNFLNSIKPFFHKSDTMKGRGRPPQHAKCNITGLQNQGIKAVPVTAEDPNTLQPDLEASHSESKDELDSHVETTLDSIVYLEVDSDYDVEEDIDKGWDGIVTQKFNNALISLTIQIEEDKRNVADEDWLPTHQQKELERAKQR